MEIPAMRKQTRKTNIPLAVKKAVWERDRGRCIICGSTAAAPVAHVIPRSHGGLGVEENIVTLCARCHRDYDQTDKRDLYRVAIEDYLLTCYPDWKEKILTYRKDDEKC
jgi:5-methylcytosine-specific restriction endonuclease McrA